MTYTWRGRQGSVLLGPAEDRVARYLAHATRHGRVTIRTMTIADDLRLGRSEAYRILRTLRILGLFGIESDQGGALGGRRIWRTSTAAGSPGLDPVKHRVAWARVTAWLKVRAARILAAVRRAPAPAGSPASPQAPTLTAGPWGGGNRSRDLPGRAIGPPLTFREAMRRWAPALAEEWRL